MMDLILTPAAIALCAQLAIVPCDIGRLNTAWAGDGIWGCGTAQSMLCPPPAEMHCIDVAHFSDRSGGLLMCRLEPIS